jgi:hypothetical protein
VNAQSREARGTAFIESAVQDARYALRGFAARPVFAIGVALTLALGIGANATMFGIVDRLLFDVGDRAGAPRVVIVDEGMGRALWPEQDPIGRCLRIGADTAPCSTVVGIAQDARTQSLSMSNTYTYYIPLKQFGVPTGMVLVRASGPAADYTEPVRRKLQALLPGTAYVTAVPLREMVAPQMRSWQLGATMFVAFGGVALALAGIGLYGVIAYGVAQRRREIGIRLALGAQRHQVLGLVVRGGLRLTAVGVVVGSAIAALLAQRAASLLFKEAPLDPVVYAGVAGVLLLVAVVATWLPAARAARVDPSVTLRSD